MIDSPKSDWASYFVLQSKLAAGCFWVKRAFGFGWPLAAALKPAGAL